MKFELEEKNIPLILKECFLFYSFKIGNYQLSELGEKKYSFNYTENTSLYNFSKMLIAQKKEYLSLEWIFEYFNYQFTYWDFYKENKEKIGEKVQIYTNWVVGQKALSRFLRKTSKDSYFYHSSFRPKYNISKEDLISTLESKNLLKIEEESELVENPLNFAEENIKKRKYNTIEGLYLCLEFTSLFKFTSPICKKCIWKDKCKIFLKRTYPILYRKRLANKIIKSKKKCQ